MECPYCRQSEADSRDHIFPDALGGRRTIPACRACNNRFGHTFEAKALADLAPVRVMLGKCGLPVPHGLVWRRAVYDEARGVHYDMGAENRLRMSRSQKMVDGSGRLRHISFPTLAKAHEAARRLRKKHGDAVVKVSHFQEKLPDSFVFSMQWHVGDDLRRLAIKMCVALARLAGMDASIMPGLLNALGPAPSSPRDVRLDSRWPGDPPEWGDVFGHYVYVEGIPETGAVTGVVRLFDLVQLDLELGRGYCGPATAHLGVLSLVSGKEEFKPVTPMGRLRAPRFVHPWCAAFQRRDLLRRLDGQVLKTTGANSYLFRPTDAYMARFLT